MTNILVSAGVPNYGNGNVITLVANQMTQVKDGDETQEVRFGFMF